MLPKWKAKTEICLAPGAEPADTERPAERHRRRDLLRGPHRLHDDQLCRQARPRAHPAGQGRLQGGPTGFYTGN